MNSYSSEVREKIDYIFGYQKKQNGYTHFRGLFKDDRAQDYPELLRDDCGRKIDTVIQGRIDSGQVVDLVDLGCGSGKFLVDSKIYWGDRIDCLGVTATDYPLPRYTQEGSRELRKKLGIEVHSGKDIHDLSDVVLPSSADIVTSVFVANYLVDEWALIREMHRILRIGGEGFVSTFSLSMEKPLEDNMRLFKWFRENDTFFLKPQLAGWQIYYLKRFQDLELPIEVADLGVRNLLYRPTF